MRLKGITSKGMQRVAKTVKGQGSSPVDDLEKHGTVTIQYLYGGGEISINEIDDSFFVHVSFPDGKSEEFDADVGSTNAEEVVDRAMGVYEEGLGGAYAEEGYERSFDYKWHVYGSSSVLRVGERSDIGRLLSRGIHAGGYDAAYEGGDWESNLERRYEEGGDYYVEDETFEAGYILAFIPGSTDNWMWDEDYLDAWNAYGKDAQALGIAVDDPWEAQQEDDTWD